MIIADSRKINKVVNLKSRLYSLATENKWDGIAFCSAFLTVEGAKYLIDLLNKIHYSNNPRITILIGIKNYFTSPLAINLILDYFKTLNNVDYQLLMPYDPDFHIKCYSFWNENDDYIIIGSANLTLTGLQSKGEMSIELYNIAESDDIFNCIDTYCKESHYWADIIDEYDNAYNINKPTIQNAKKDNLFKVKVVNNNIKKIRKTAPTMGELYSIDKATQNRINSTYELAKKSYPNINKSNAIIYTDTNHDEFDDIKNNYPIDAWFDRPRGNNEYWEIGQHRMLCRIGGYGLTLENELVMFMQRGNIHYTVNNKIFEKATELGICKEDFLPSEKIIKEYIKFVKQNRK